MILSDYYVDLSFFVKQKTAYDLRISDWSSDVCSSDLRHAVAYLDKRILMAEVEQNFPDPRALDGWVPKQDFTGRKSFVRAFAPRLIHVLPGNSPGVAVKSIAQGAMVKAVNLFKMSSADPFTMVAILRTMRSEERRVGKGCVSTW